jgi:hypothetical protein
MELYHNNKLVRSDSYFAPADVANIEIEWNHQNDIYYTLIIYDIDTPFTYVHLLVTNIPRNDIEYGTIVLNYVQPNPPSGNHRYVIAIYEQRGLMIDSKFGARSRFPLLDFIKQNNLKLVDEKIITSGNSNNNLKDDPPKYHSNSNSVIRQDSDLNGRSEKYCSCVVKVAEKNTERCNLEKDWGNMSDGKMCYSPYAVCAKSTGTTNRNCGMNYDYDSMTKEQLSSFLNLNGIKTNRSMDRAELLRISKNKKL